jgi:hypothetical protein
MSKRSHRLVSEDKVNVATKCKHVINKLFENEAKRNACALAKKNGKKITWMDVKQWDALIALDARIVPNLYRTYRKNYELTCLPEKYGQTWWKNTSKKTNVVASRE